MLVPKENISEDDMSIVQAQILYLEYSAETYTNLAQGLFLEFCGSTY